MTNHTGANILFDVAGGFLIPNYESKSLDKSIIEQEIKTFLRDVPQILGKDIENNIKKNILDELKKTYNEEDTSNKILKALLGKVNPEIESLKRTVMSSASSMFNSAIGSYFNITKTYIGFNKRRLVNVAEGKDPNDVVIKKQVIKMIEELENKLKVEANKKIDKRSIDEEEMIRIENAIRDVGTQLDKKTLHSRTEHLELYKGVTKRVDDIVKEIGQIKLDYDYLKIGLRKLETKLLNK